MQSSKRLQNNVKKVSLFGSYLHGNNRQGSDVDLLIELNPTIQIGLFEFAAIQREFADALKVSVDVVTPRALSKFFRDKVIREAEPLYE